MERYSQKQLKALVRHGLAKDVTRATERNEIPEPLGELSSEPPNYFSSELL